MPRDNASSKVLRWLSLVASLAIILAASGVLFEDPRDIEGSVAGVRLNVWGVLLLALFAVMVVGVLTSYWIFRWRVTWFLVATVAASAGFQSDWFQFVLMWGLIVTLLMTYRKFLGKFFVYILSHPSQVVILFVFFLMLYGLGGTNAFGVPSLFWHEGPWGRFCAAGASVVFLAVLGTNAYFLDDCYKKNQKAIGEFLERNQIDYGAGLRELPVLGRVVTCLDLLEPGRDRDGKPILDEEELPTIAAQVARLLRLARLPFLTLASLPALYPLQFPYVPRLAPVRGLRDWIKELMSTPDVGRDPTAWLLGVSIWTLGLLVGIFFVKGLVRLSPWLESLYKRKIGPAVGSRTKLVSEALKKPVYGSPETSTEAAASSGQPTLNRPKALVATVSITIVLLALVLSWWSNTSGSDPSHVSSPLGLAYVAVGLSLIAAVVWSGFRAYELRPERWPPFLRYLSLFLLLYLFIRCWPPESLAPGISVCTLLIALSLFGGWLRQLRPPASCPDAPAGAHPRPLFRSDLLALGLVVIWVGVMNGDDFKMQFDPMSYAPDHRADWAAAVHDYVEWGDDGLSPRPDESWKDPDATGVATATPGLRRTGRRTNESKEEPPGLLDDVDVLTNWRTELWKRTPGYRPGGDGPPNGFRPKLAVVCVTGGASRAQYWTAVVLRRLGRSTPATGVGLSFHDGVRLVTGASGGMVGAAYYLAWRDDVRGDRVRPDDGSWVDRMDTDPLPDVARHIALVGVPKALFPRLPRRLEFGGCRVLEELALDRGRVLEQGWTGLQRPFRSYRSMESRGLIPSLVFTPVTVDDGRRILISNLALEHLAVNHGDEIYLWANRRRAYSVAAPEFYRVFGRQGDPLTLAMAARMSGSFPMVSPAVNLPTNPPIRVVDAGYYDNYGVNLAVAWIARNRHWLEQWTSGVALVQIRAFMGRKERLGPADPTGDAFSNGFQFVSTPFTAFLSARETTPMFRNDEEIDGLSDLLAEETGCDDFFATVIFEISSQVLLETDRKVPDALNPWPGLKMRSRARTAAPVTDVAMTWYLSEYEKRSMDQAIPTDADAQRWTLDDRGDLDSKVDPNHPSFYKDPARRLWWLNRMRLRVLGFTSEPDGLRLRSFGIKEMERALNYERIRAFQSWWGRGYICKGHDCPARPELGGGPDH